MTKKTKYFICVINYELIHSTEVEGYTIGGYGVREEYRHCWSINCLYSGFCVGGVYKTREQAIDIAKKLSSAGVDVRNGIKNKESLLELKRLGRKVSSGGNNKIDPSVEKGELQRIRNAIKLIEPLNRQCGALK